MWNDFFRDGGWGMYPTTIFGFLLIAAGALYLFRPESRYAPIVLATGFLTLAAGLLGMFTGLVTTFRYVHQVPQADQFQIALQGTAESTNNMILALILCVIAGILTLGGLVRGLRRSPSAA
jgi:hypothetical protein